MVPPRLVLGRRRLNSAAALRRSRSGSWPSRHPALAAGAVTAVVIALIPVIYLVARTAEYSPAVLLEQLGTPRMARLASTSLGLVASATALCLVIGVSLAVLVTRTRLPGRRWLAVAAALPLAIPSYVAAFGWSSLSSLVDPLGTFSGFGAAVFVITLVSYPAGRRELGNGAAPAARFNGPRHPSAGQLASRLVTGIRLRNAFTFVNDYYDDMAWLALATLRLDGLAQEARRPGRRRNARLREALTLQFDSASTDDLGGGTFWSRKRDFKNTPATAPVALYYARTGQQVKAQRLVDWLNAVLFDDALGLYLDGARLNAAGEVVVEGAIYTYNQGPVLGALLELGGEANLARAAALVDAVAHQLTVPGRRILRCDGTGDGGLFTGILCRYLALAALDARLPETARVTAAELVKDTAEAFWTGRRAARRQAPSASGVGFIFSIQAAQPADTTYPPGAAVELSTQLQAWMAIEAAATIQQANAN